MRIDLRDGIKDELDTKVTLTLRWMFRIILLSLVLGAILFAWITQTRADKSDAIESRIVKLFDVSRGVSDTSYGTYWKHCGGWFTADHVHEAMNLDAPKFIKHAVVRAPGVIDAAWYGKNWTCGAPANLKVGTPVYVLGYPGGSDAPTLRQGRVHYHRMESGSDGYQTPTWVVVFGPRGDVGLSGEAVVLGMSGGIVTDMDFNPVGILVTQNSPADINGDGELDQSVDIVSLADAYRILIKN